MVTLYEFFNNNRMVVLSTTSLKGDQTTVSLEDDCSAVPSRFWGLFGSVTPEGVWVWDGRGCFGLKHASAQTDHQLLQVMSTAWQEGYDAWKMEG